MPKPPRMEVVPLVAGRPGEPDARHEIEILHLRFAERDQAGNAGDRIERLRPLARRYRGPLVAQAQVDREIRPDLPVVVEIRSEFGLVAVVDRIAGGPLRRTVRNLIAQETLQRGPFVVAARALREALRADVLAEIDAELQGVRALDPAHVVGALIRILDGLLGRDGIRSDVDPQFVDGHVRKLVQPRILLRADPKHLILPVEAQTELIGQRGREVVELRQSGHVVV